jgi:ABC-2 type transport system ATP-binding protein
MDEAQELSSRVAIIHRGRIVALGAPDELIHRLGAGQTLRLHTTAPADGELAAALRQVNGVSQVVPGADAITLTLGSAAAVLPDILRVADGLGLCVDSLTIQQPNLEDVFLRLTGESLAEVSQ